MKKIHSLSAALFITSAVGISSNSYSAPGILDDLPLDISTRVQPNILFLLDDSGSMDWEQLISADAQAAYNIDSNGTAYLNFQPSSDEQVNALCLEYNLMAYNPSVVYEPWTGQDANNVDFDNKTLTTALDNPYFTGNPVDISDHIYMVSVDTNSNQIFDAGECGNYANIATPTLTPGGYNIYTLGTDTSSTDASGYIVDSGGVNGPYGNNELHGFLIDPVGATEITISFSAFNVESFFDFLRIYSGTSNAGTLIATLDGNDLPPTITINSPTVFVEFDTDFSVTPEGFILFWNHSSSGNVTPNLSSVDLDSCRADPNCRVVADAPLGGEPATNTPENYANWYTYYRKREYVAKKAMSDIIDDSVSRMGLATLHNNGNGGTQIEDMRIAARKNELFDNLFSVDSQFGTPLRQTLAQAGEYFEEGDTPPIDFLGFVPDHAGDGTVSNDSPILNASNGGQCQQNFAVVFSDGFWNGGDPGVGDQDGDLAGNPYDGGWFADTYLMFNPNNLNNTLADVAMRYLKNDLSATLNNVNNVNDIRTQNGTRNIPHQHLTTYTVAFGLEGNLANDPNDVAFTGWTDPTDGEDRDRIDDMRHAAWNGRGEFLSASNPQELIASLNASINDISDRTGTAAAASFNAGSISSDTLVFQSIFSTEDWSGDILAYGFDNNGIVGSAPIWRASDQVAGQTVAERNVFTFNGTVAVPFNFPANYRAPIANEELSLAQINDLLTNSDFNVNTTDTTEIAVNQAFGSLVVNYLKGDDSFEQNTTGTGEFRARNGNPLGAFIHSSPQFVGSPNDIYPNLIEGASDPYLDFRTATTMVNRTPIVYAGGNAGMLHAFNASTGGTGGEEIFAYIPSFLINNLHTLTETDYSHLAYVDLTPTIRDVFVGGEWRTYLVGGARSGGRGIYILDVTDPASIVNSATLTDLEQAQRIVQHEYTNVNLGATYSRPQIAKMNNGSWVAIFGNGYNSDGDGRAKLFILDLATGMPLVSDAIGILDTGVGNNNGGSCLDEDVTAVDGDPASDCNGLSSPTIVDLNGDFLVDRIYAGDLHGNMWVFNVSSSDPSNWDVGFGGDPLFTACATSGSTCSVANRQPITVKPEVLSHPTRRGFATSPNVLVYFGTGQFLAEGDASTTSLKSFYGVWDAGSTNANSSFGNLNKSDLLDQTFSFDATNGFDVTNNPINYTASSSGTFGWYVDLEVTGGNFFNGGRAVINPLLLNELVLFLVTVPSGEVCNREGSTFLVALDNYNGGRPDFFVFDTDNTPGADSNEPIIELDSVAVGLGSLSSGGETKLITTNSDGSIGIESIVTMGNIPTGRKSWSILR